MQSIDGRTFLLWPGMWRFAQSIFQLIMDYEKN